MTTFSVFASKSWESERIRDEARELGLDTHLYEYYELNLANLKIPDIAVFRTVVDRIMGLDNTRIVQKIVKKMSESGGYVFNTGACLRAPIDKLKQQRLIRKNALPGIRDYKLDQRLPYPVIVKPKRGSLGIGVELIKNKEELKEFFAEHEIKEYLIQEQMELGRDYRVIVLGGEALGVMERTAMPGKIVANFSQGGTVRGVELSDEVLEMAIKAASIIGLEFAGVDLIRDQNGGWSVLEVNRCPQFRGFEQATGVNVAKKIVEYCVRQAKR